MICVVCCVLYVVCCMLCVVCCMLYVVCCMLYVVMYCLCVYDVCIVCLLQAAAERGAARVGFDIITVKTIVISSYWIRDHDKIREPFRVNAARRGAARRGLAWHGAVHCSAVRYGVVDRMV